MSPILVGVLGFSALLVLLLAGVPVFASMCLVAVGGLWALLGWNPTAAKLAFQPFLTITSETLACITLFIVMANVINVSGMATGLYAAAAKWLGGLRGGLAIATVGGCALFSACSGSSVSTAATMSLVAMPEMNRYKYHPGLSTATIAAGGSMGVLIPPSSAFILYGVITETSIGKLFMAGVIPGIMQAVMYMLVIYMICRVRPSYGPPVGGASFIEKIRSLSGCIEIVILVAAVMGGLFAGLITATEAGAVGAVGAIVLALLRRRLSWTSFMKALKDSMRSIGMIYAILIGAFVLQYFVALSTIPTALAEYVQGLSIPPLLVMVIIIVVYLLLGCFLESMSMMLLTLPVFFPLIVSLGFDPIWFGVILVMTTEVGLITPPVGMNAYIIAGLNRDVPMETIFKGCLPFVASDFARLAIVLLVPMTALFLPGLS